MKPVVGRASPWWRLIAASLLTAGLAGGCRTSPASPCAAAMDQRTQAMRAVIDTDKALQEELLPVDRALAEDRALAAKRRFIDAVADVSRFCGQGS